MSGAHGPQIEKRPPWPLPTSALWRPMSMGATLFADPGAASPRDAALFPSCPFLRSSRHNPSTSLSSRPPPSRHYPIHLLASPPSPPSRPLPPLPPFPPSSFSATMTFFDERRKACLHRMGVGAAMGAGVGGAAGLLFGAAESRRYAIPTSQVRVAAGGGFLYGIFLGEGSAEVVEGGRERRGTGAGG